MDEPRVTPAQIPPLVPQHMLRPTAANKMRNAVIDYRNFGGQLAESTFAPSDTAEVERNNIALEKMLGGKIPARKELGAEIGNSYKTLSAWTMPLGTAARSYRWYDPRTKESKFGNPLKLQMEFIEGRAGRTEIQDWLFLAPQISKPRGKKHLAGVEFDVVFRSRHVSQPARFHTYNDPFHRAFARHICKQIKLPRSNADLNSLRGQRGVMIYYAVTENEAANETKPAVPPFTVGFTLLFPNNDIRSLIGFSVRRPNQPPEAVIDLDD
jgi:hypothetical protein